MNNRSSFFNRSFAGVLLFLSFLFSQDISAQADEKKRNGRPFERFKAEGDRTYHHDRPYYIGTWKGELPKAVRIIRQLDDTTGIVGISSPEELELLRQVAALRPANDLWKFSPNAAEQATRSNKEQEFILSAIDVDELIGIVKNIPGMQIVAEDRPSSSVIIKASAKLVNEKLLPLKQVIFVDIKTAARAEVSIIGYNRSFHGLSAVDHSLNGANGKNIVAGVKEQRMQDADLDLYKRVLTSPLAGGNITNHATVVSSIIGGAGNSFYDGRGIAWACKFFSSSFDNLFADDAAVLNTNKVTVQNHSYGTVIQQFYGAEAVSYDAHTWANKNFIHVFSAGNQGTSSAATGRYANISGYANLTGNFKMAKNIITVGAIDNKGNIPAESSAGPLYDGRVAPQLIALGPNGTSDAAAVVSGTVAVLQQVYADSNSQSIPAASLLKGILYNSADDVHNTGIDHKTGYGLLNSFEAVKTLQQKRYDGSSLLQGQQWTKVITIPVNAAQLKVTLVWTDSTSPVNNNKALINDLDLEISGPGGTVYLPWVLSSAANADSLRKLAARKRDSLNTAEQVSIQFPVSGTYQVRVYGTAILNGPLPFHIVYSVDTLQTFLFTSPQHSSDVNRSENPVLDIRWRTFVADTNQAGNLYISYNAGASWQLIKAAQKIYTNYYPWPVRDTASRAMLRMETIFGDFYSKEFVISKVNSPVIDFLCADSLGLSWNRHIYATGYKIFALTDSAYLRHLYTVTDTFTVIKRNQFPQLVFAVEPVLSNAIPAARSIAFDITLQGVKCFYKTFYHVLQDRNELNLVLELSAAAYVDSVYYEWVTANGQLLRTVGSSKTTAAVLYQHLVTTIPQGTSYWRARIRLKSGAFVYTEVIPVLSSGKRHILFYPNPASRNVSLTWVLQQGTPASSGIQLFDATGRMLASYTELPASIDIRGFAPGLLIYKLIGAGNKLIEAGKILIQ